MTQATAKPRMFSTVDLLTMAVIAVVAALLNSYVWFAVMNVATPLFAFLGPVGWIGASGVYMIAPVLVGLLIGRMGAATIYGLIQGFLEMLLGNPAGALSIVYAGLQGLSVDASLAVFRYKPTLPAALLGGAIGNLVADVIYLFVYGLATPGNLIVGGITALISGAVLGGLVAWLLVLALQRTGVVSRIGLKGYQEI
ncbi:MAG: ECF transporter S component [Anaerolineales bacterium]|nr:ECF transporter S component [Anaerolineales bacterium]